MSQQQTVFLVFFVFCLYFVFVLLSKKLHFEKKNILKNGKAVLGEIEHLKVFKQVSCLLGQESFRLSQISPIYLPNIFAQRNISSKYFCSANICHVFLLSQIFCCMLGKECCLCFAKYLCQISAKYLSQISTKYL